MLANKKFYERTANKNSVYEGGSINIVFLGDSVTHGVFELTEDPYIDYDRFGSHSMKFHKMLCTLFPWAHFNIINSGVNGDSAQMGLARFERDVLSYRPDLVVISFGLNDHENVDIYLDSLSQMFDRLNQLDIPCVYLTENMMNTFSADDTAKKYKEYSEHTCVLQNEGAMDRLFDAGISLAKSKGITVCDMYHKWKTLEKCGADITHLLANRINHPIRDMHDFTAFSMIQPLFFE